MEHQYTINAEVHCFWRYFWKSESIEIRSTCSFTSWIIFFCWNQQHFFKTGNWLFFCFANNIKTEFVWLSLRTPPVYNCRYRFGYWLVVIVWRLLKGDNEATFLNSTWSQSFFSRTKYLPFFKYIIYLNISYILLNIDVNIYVCIYHLIALHCYKKENKKYHSENWFYELRILDFNVIKIYMNYASIDYLQSVFWREFKHFGQSFQINIFSKESE